MENIGSMSPSKVGAREVSEVPVHQLPANLGLGDMDQVLLQVYLLAFNIGRELEQTNTRERTKAGREEKKKQKETYALHGIV